MPVIWDEALINKCNSHKNKNIFKENLKLGWVIPLFPHLTIKQLRFFLNIFMEYYWFKVYYNFAYCWFKVFLGVLLSTRMRVTLCWRSQLSLE